MKKITNMFHFTGQMEEPGAYSSRVLCLSLWVGHMVLLAAYSATLVSFLTVQRYEIPFTDLESLLSEKGFTFQMLSQNSITYFSNVIKIIYMYIIDINFTAYGKQTLKILWIYLTRHQWNLMDLSLSIILVISEGIKY